MSTPNIHITFSHTHTLWLKDMHTAIWIAVEANNYVAVKVIAKHVNLSQNKETESVHVF